MAAQGREANYTPVFSDPDAVYDRVIDIDLSQLKPMIACPHSPDNVVAVETLKDVKVDQVCIGSCTNSSLLDMLKVAAMLKGKTIAPGVSLSISPGSRQVLTMLSESGALADILSSGARLLECACGPCIGMGFSPSSGGVSLRTFNRNFLGRSGTKDGQVYLVSPEVAVASALTGYITDPMTLDPIDPVILPDTFRIDDSGVLPPAADGASVEVLRGPNIKEFPKSKPFANDLTASAVLKVGDNITPTILCPPEQRSCLIAPIFRTFPSSALRCAILRSRSGQKQQGTASSLAEAIMVRAHLGNTLPLSPCTWAFAA